MPGFGAQVEYADYFMDYRNGDGSVAEMCGNGARVFVRYLVLGESLEQAGDLHRAPEVSPAALFPDGANIEFVIGEGERHVAMRVHERGVGETLSCGTGACAVAWAARRRFEPGISGSTTWRVDVPGGSLTVTESETGACSLTGPATLVARGTVLLP